MTGRSGIRRRLSVLFVLAGLVSTVAVGEAAERGARLVRDGSNFSVTEATSLQLYPAVGYNSDADQYLVVWEDDRIEHWDGLWGQIVSADGSRLGSDFQIKRTYNIEAGAVVYNPDAGEYLVVWRADGSPCNFYFCDQRVWARRVSASGELLDGPFTVTVRGGWLYQRSPDAVFNPDTGEYLIVWDDSRDSGQGPHIFGQRISSTGERLGGGNFRVSASGPAGMGAAPAITYNGDTGEYLVVWQDRSCVSPCDTRIMAQRLSATGERLGPSVPISGDIAASRSHADVSYSPHSGGYLAVWGDARGSETRWMEIWGRCLSASGEPLGTEFRVNGPFVMEDFRTDAQLPSIDYDLSTDRFIVVWKDGRAETTRGYDIWSQQLSATGDRLGPDLRISGPAATRSEVSSALACGRPGNCLVAFSDGRGDAGTDIWAQILAPAEITPSVSTPPP